MTRKFSRRTTLKAGTAAIGVPLLGAATATGDEADGATLYAARDVPVGTVRVEQDGDRFVVTYDTADSAWEITEAHLHVATEVDAIPTNGSGNPRLGHFDRAGEPDAATDEIEFADISVEDGVERVAVVAHAEVRRGERTEGAWAGSESITDRGNWARYFEYEVEPVISGTIVEANGDPGTDDRLVYLGPRDGDDPDFDSIYTDEEGAFSTQVAEPGTYSLGYYQRERWNASTPERDGSPDVYKLGPIDVEGVTDLGRIDLPDAHVLDVRVVDEDGNPIEDAPVNFYAESWGISRRHTTNADGYFQYDGLEKTGIELLGNVLIQVWEPGTDPEPGNYAVQRRIELDSSRTEEFVLEGVRGEHEITGTIYEPDGEPASDDKISYIGPSTDGTDRVYTDDGGSFSVAVEEPGSYGLGYFQRRDGQGSGPVRDGTPDVYNFGPVDVDGATELDAVELPEAHVLDVRVVDQDGTPIEGAPVQVWSCTAEFTSCWGWGRLETNADGYFQHHALDETGIELVGDVRIRVWDPDEADPQWDNYAVEREIDLAESRTEEFVLAPSDGTVEITGTIYEPDGEPATDDRIAAVSRSTFQNVYTGDDGRFRVEVDGSDTYSLGYYQKSAGRGTDPVRDGSPDIYAIDRVDVDAAPIDIGVVELPEAHVLDVRIVDGSGTPVEGAPVSVYGCESGSCWGSGRHDTNAEGYFQYPDLTETGVELVGDARILVWDPDESDPTWGNQAIERELTVTKARTVELVLDG